MALVMVLPQTAAFANIQTDPVRSTVMYNMINSLISKIIPMHVLVGINYCCYYY